MSRWSAAPCATCCSGARRASWTSSSRTRTVVRRCDLAASLGVSGGESADGRFGVIRLTSASARRSCRLGVAGASTSPSGAPSPIPRPARCPRCAREPSSRTCAAGTSPSTRSRLSSAAPAWASCPPCRRALDDLAHARLRVLHERSFLDDPTRLLRLARYLARLEFEPEAHTARARRTGARERCAGHRVRRSHRRGAAPAAERAGPPGGAREPQHAGRPVRSAPPGCASTSTSRAGRSRCFPRTGSPICCCSGPCSWQ